jgi:transcriptional regulator with XRE-family HTH domain
MNRTTQRIKSKGYTLPQFLKVTGISLSTYRRYEKESNANHVMLNRLISELENR